MPASFLLCAMLSLTAPGGGAAEAPPPPNEPPELWRAVAEQRDGKVVIQLAEPVYVAPRETTPAEKMEWRLLKEVTLGVTIDAYGVDGKAVKPQVLLMALSEPTAVAVFVRFGRPPLPPDPYYLRLFRDGVIVFVVDGADIADPIP